MIKRISPEQIKIGMFVCGFGGSWFDHPFWRTKFVVASESEFEKIRMAAIPYVEIDEGRGCGPEAENGLTLAPPAPGINNLARSYHGALHSRHTPERAVARVRIPQAAASPAALEELHREQILRLVDGAKSTMRGLFDDARMGRALRTQDTVRLIDDITVAVSRSPRIILDIVRLKKKDEYTFMHSVAVCALMINAAQFLGKSASEVRDYGQAGLLHDVGKMGIPEEILNKPGPLTDAEFMAVRAHPNHGYELLAGSGEVSELALDVCRHHHEKQDGTGYPFGKNADEISDVAALGAICDVYDAMTSNRVYKPAWTPVEAVSAMWGWEGHFHPKLLFAFMQSIGIFPEGMLVRLRSNRLGLVCAARRKDSGPRVLAFYSTRDRELITPQQLYLADGVGLDSIVSAADPQQWALGNWERLRASLLAKKPLRPDRANSLAQLE